MKKYRTLHKSSNRINKKEYDYLTNFEQTTSNFFMVYQNLQNKEINEACKTFTLNYVELDPPNNLTFRPVVAGQTCKTHRLSNLTDILLQSYTKYIKSYVKDTKDFLQKLPPQIFEDSI